MLFNAWGALSHDFESERWLNTLLTKEKDEVFG